MWKGDPDGSKPRDGADAEAEWQRPRQGLAVSDLLSSTAAPERPRSSRTNSDLREQAERTGDLPQQPAQAQQHLAPPAPSQGSASSVSRPSSSASATRVPLSGAQRPATGGSASHVQLPETTSTDSSGVAYQYTAVSQITQGRENIEYQLTVREQPKHSRMCGVGEKADRRPIDPAPIIQLRVITHEASSRDRSTAGASDHAGGAAAGCSSASRLRRGVPVMTQRGEGWEDKAWYLENPYYFMYAMLADADTDEELHLLQDGKTRYTTGSCVSCLYHLKDIDGSHQGFFVFPDLSIRVEGRYRLKLCLFETIGHEVHHCKSIYSTPFSVYTAKRFPGMEESTLLSKSLADQGLKVRVRKNPRARRGRVGAKRKEEGQSEEDSDGEGAGGARRALPGDDVAMRDAKRMRGDSLAQHSGSGAFAYAPPERDPREYKERQGYADDAGYRRPLPQSPSFSSQEAFYPAPPRRAPELMHHPAPPRPPFEDPNAPYGSAHPRSYAPTPHHSQVGTPPTDSPRSRRSSPPPHTYDGSLRRPSPETHRAPYRAMLAEPTPRLRAHSNATLQANAQAESSYYGRPSDMRPPQLPPLHGGSHEPAHAAHAAYLSSSSSLRDRSRSDPSTQQALLRHDPPRSRQTHSSDSPAPFSDRTLPPLLQPSSPYGPPPHGLRERAPPQLPPPPGGARSYSRHPDDYARHPDEYSRHPDDYHPSPSAMPSRPAPYYQQQQNAERHAPGRVGASAYTAEDRERGYAPPPGRARDHQHQPPQPGHPAHPQQRSPPRAERREHLPRYQY